MKPQLKKKGVRDRRKVGDERTNQSDLEYLSAEILRGNNKGNHAFTERAPCPTDD